MRAAAPRTACGRQFGVLQMLVRLTRGASEKNGHFPSIGCFFAIHLAAVPLPPPPPPPRPFLDLLDVDSGEARRIWQSAPPFYEYTSSILSDLVRRGQPWFGFVFWRSSIAQLGSWIKLALCCSCLLSERLL